MNDPQATHDYRPGELSAAQTFIKRTWAELRELRKVRVWRDRLQVFDVNGDYFEVRGLGHEQADVIALLRLVNAAYDPDTILKPPPRGEYRELDTGRRHAWAADRAM